jgi:hypothetical protein
MTSVAWLAFAPNMSYYDLPGYDPYPRKAG